MGHRVPVPGVHDVEVEAHRAVVDPFGDVVADVGQRPEAARLGLREHGVTAALPLLEGVRVVGGVALAHGEHRLVEAGERPVAQLRDDPGGRVLHGALRGRLLLGLPDLGRHDGGHVVLAERLVGVVEYDLALARVPDHAGLQVVAHGALRHASPELVHVHVAAQPGALPHVQRRLEVGLLAEREHADEQVDLRGLPGDRVHQPPADRRAGPVDLARHARLVLDALGQVVRRGVVAVALAEPGVAHGDHVPARALRLVLVVQQAQVDADLRHLGVHVGPVGLLEGALVHVAVGVEQLVDLLVPHALHPVPGDAAIVCDVEHLADAAHGHVPGPGDRPPRHALVAELHYELRPYLPCHVVSPSVNRLHGKPILRAEERRYGNGGTGDTEGAKRLDGKRYGKRETDATQSAQYSRISPDALEQYHAPSLINQPELIEPDSEK